jgi:hypothetical protein
MTPGLHRIEMKEYLELSAVSSGLLQTTIDECPFAAWWDSWLNTKRSRDESSSDQDAGSIAHSIFLEGRADIVQIVEADDWRTKAAKEAREAARLEGKIPVLAARMPKIIAMVAAVHEFIASLEHSEPAIWHAFQPDGGDSELTMLWDEADALHCRARPDRLARDRRVIIDYKTATSSAEPDGWGRRQLVGCGYYIAAAFYRRGIAKLFNVDPEYVYVVQQQEAPYLCSLVGIDPAGRELGDRKIRRALATWSSCVATGKWPAYPSRAVYPEFPQWEFAREEEHEGHAIPYDPAKIWQKPPRTALESFVDNLPE